MKNKMIPNKKAMLSMMVSIIVGLGASGVSYAAGLKATSDDKGGSFKYVTPTGGADQNKCPGPYESMALTFVNKTNDVTPGHGNGLGWNIYYIVNDEREYKGPHAFVENDNKTFPYEIRNVTGSGAYSGYLLDKNLKKQTPIKKWGEGSFNESDNLKELYGDVKLMTVYIQQGDYLDINSGVASSVTVRIPVRSYKLLYIVPIASTADLLTLDPKSKDFTGGTRAVQAFLFQAESLSPDNPSLVTAKAKRGGAGVNPLSNWRPASDDVKMATFPYSKDIDLRTVDELIFTVKGYDSYNGGIVQETDEQIVERNKNFFGGSDIQVKYLLDKVTGKPIVCN